MQDDLMHLTASQLQERLQSRELSVAELAKACLERIEARDSAVRAWAHVDRELVLAQARELDRTLVRGPLHGLPIGIKDVILTKDMPTQYNSPIYLDSHPTMDAACVTILRAAGALILGKTTTVEFGATGRKPPTRNPHDLKRTPGGSSSGSAAAVADLHVPLALGTQTGGSIIRPASYCGVFAMKPTWNRVSNEGARRFSPSLDTIGWFARSAEDLALLFQVFDPDSSAHSIAEPHELRIGLYRPTAWGTTEQATQAALAAAEQRLRDAGVHVEELTLPSDFDALVDEHRLIMLTEARSSFLAEFRTHYELLHESFREQVENRNGYTYESLRAAYDHAAKCRSIFDRIAADFDAILAPSTVGEAPVGLADTGSFAFNGPWTLLHVPCINVPCYWTKDGLPVGLTLVGPRFSDERVLGTAVRIAMLFGIRDSARWRP
ncbi:MAG TPA: amidase [Steroidobacteraceae bacterium]